MKATHYYTDDFDFYESEYVVEDNRIIAYRIKGSVWCNPNPENKYERFPKIEDLRVVK